MSQLVKPGEITSCAVLRFQKNTEALLCELRYVRAATVDPLPFA